MADPKPVDDRAAARAAKAELVKKQIAEGQKLQADAVAEFNAGLKGAKPTPTPAEADAAKLGHPVAEPEDDGSGPERAPPQPHLGRPGVTNPSVAGKSATYQTREAESKK